MTVKGGRPSWLPWDTDLLRAVSRMSGSKFGAEAAPRGQIRTACAGDTPAGRSGGI